MIRSFADDRTRRVFVRERVPAFSPRSQRAAWKKLAILHGAGSLADLSEPPGNRLEELSGRREGQYCIRINDECASASRGEKGMHSTSRSRTFIKEAAMAPRKMAPVHPGEILMGEFLEPMEIQQYRLSKDIGVPPRRINEIVYGKRGISPDTALRLSRHSGLSEMIWSNPQPHYDLEVKRDRLGDRLEKEV
jgi:addiction module HigA family antidote